MKDLICTFILSAVMAFIIMVIMAIYPEQSEIFWKVIKTILSGGAPI